MSKKIILWTVDIMIIILSLYIFFKPSLLTTGGYDLSVDGIVVARTMILIFAFYNIIKLNRNFLFDGININK